MQLNDLIAYIVMNYKNKDDLSTTRLQKIIYLIDWESAMHTGKQITRIKWCFINHGPFTTDIATLFILDRRFYIENHVNNLDMKKNIVRIKTNEFQKPLGGEKVIIDLIIDLTQELSWHEFINVVYSTFPIKESEPDGRFDLVKLAKEYRDLG